MTVHARRLRAALPLLPALLALAAASAPPARAQTDGAPFPRGEVAKDVVARADSTQRYAVYLPSAYDASRAWPVVFLMDPRGRAELPLELYREPAERLGYVLLSSYNTLSDADSAADVNERALGAMLTDAQERLAMDAQRVYLAGFSGTARAAWGFAPRMGGAVAGVVGTGGGMPGPAMLWRGMLGEVRPFAFFGSAGRWDFNHHEMTALDAWLDDTAFPHRFVYFDGGHEWYPAEVAAEALGWLHLQAMKTGGVPRDERFVDSLLAARTASAQRLETAGHGADALAEWRSVVADFGALRDVAAAEGRVAALADDRSVRRTLERRAELDRDLRAYLERVRDFIGDFDRAGRAIPAARAARTLRVDRLLAQAADTADVDASLTARRMLENAFVTVSYYQPQRYAGTGQWEKALEMVRLGRIMKPEARWLCYRAAQALAGLGRADEALGELRCAVEAGAVPAGLLDHDPRMAPLRTDPRFTALRDEAERRSEAARSDDGSG